MSTARRYIQRVIVCVSDTLLELNHRIDPMTLRLDTVVHRVLPALVYVPCRHLGMIGECVSDA